MCMCARSYVFVYSVHRLSFKRSSSIQFTLNLNFTDLMKLLCLYPTSCVHTRTDTRPPNLQTNSKAEEADDASGAVTAPADDEVCL